VSSNTIQNYHFEGVQFNSGPYSIAENTYATISNCRSSVALSTFVNYGLPAGQVDYSSVDATDANMRQYFINNTFYFANNTVSGGCVGVAASSPGIVGTFSQQPYSTPLDLYLSGNRFRFDPPPANPPPTVIHNTAMLILSYDRNVFVAGNTVSNTVGSAFLYGTGDLPADNAAQCRIFARANDFSLCSLHCLLTQTAAFSASHGFPAGGLVGAKFIANRIGGPNGDPTGHFLITGDSANILHLNVTGSQFYRTIGISTYRTDQLNKNDLSYTEWTGAPFGVNSQDSPADQLAIFELFTGH